VVLAGEEVERESGELGGAAKWEGEHGEGCGGRESGGRERERKYTAEKRVHQGHQLRVQ